jgi:ADP-ribosyl-[dinitrogen reductase] hydrolase
VTRQDRYRGALLGLAAGDALGTTLEFKRPGSFTPIADMVGGGPFGLQAGEWTDDTSMALCLAESLVECRRFDPVDQLQRYVRWWREGYHSSTGRCFDIGVTARGALERFQRTGAAWYGSTNPQTAGNGSLMRLAPVPLFFASDPARAIARAADSSRTTHGAPEAVDACRYFAGLIVGAVDGRSKTDLLAPGFAPVDGLWDDAPLAPAIAEVANGSFSHREPPQIAGTGYVVRSLEAALWAFAKSTTFEDGALLAVNLGDDADTTGAIYGQIAGAYYGVEGIPARWRKKLAGRETLERLAGALSVG